MEQTTITGIYTICEYLSDIKKGYYLRSDGFSLITALNGYYTVIAFIDIDTIYRLPVCQYQLFIYTSNNKEEVSYRRSLFHLYYPKYFITPIITYIGDTYSFYKYHPDTNHFNKLNLETLFALT